LGKEEERPEKHAVKNTPFSLVGGKGGKDVDWQRGEQRKEKLGSREVTLVELFAALDSPLKGRVYTPEHGELGSTY
jgi:hypothetical protein